MISAMLLTVLIFFIIVYGQVPLTALKNPEKCERITIPLCQDLPYNMTRMPNLMGHTNQADAAIEVHEYVSLVKFGCSQHLKFFLCSLYAPMCAHQVDVPIPSCRSVCEEVKARCFPILERLAFGWPTKLSCSRLPVPGKNGLCMELPDITEERRSRNKESEKGIKAEKGKTNYKSINPNLLPSRLYPKTREDGISDVDGGKEEYSYGGKNVNIERDLSAKFCPRNFVSVLSKTTSVKTCVPRCDRDILFSRHDKNVVDIWMIVWSAFCFMATLLTVATFWVDTARFRYPERPIIFLSMCCCNISIAYLVRSFAGAEFISCEKTERDSYLVKEGLESTGCIIVFLLLYYFGMAAALWWLVLTCAWFLAAGRKWGHEAIESRASYFHVLAWGVPAILTIIVLTLRQVEGEELTGLCNVGSRSRDALLRFVIFPLCFFFFFGSVFIILGFSSLVRIRRVMKQGDRNTNKLERHMVRIGTFSILYTVPAISVIACQVYEYINRPGWYAVAMDTAPQCSYPTAGGCSLDQSIPSEEVFMLKHAMTLLQGIATGVWVWNSKTWNSWATFFNNQIRRKPRRSVKSPTIVYRPPHVVLLK
ncbi:frizzled-9-like [Limulus polyphemus]|uniref:Frizzled-9-like n=1 Tax=Limulus polyphemus TaxID=6850 RepID=A0ABM1BGH5_LIMPO|nr:frizzled-9-like [Limulus polyphemus]